MYKIKFDVQKKNSKFTAKCIDPNCSHIKTNGSSIKILRHKLVRILNNFFSDKKMSVDNDDIHFNHIKKGK